MQYVRLGQSGLKVSRLCLGTMNIGSKAWKPWIFDESESEPIIKYAIDNGVNFIDLADFYSTGVGEEVVCNVLRRIGQRDRMILTTKVGYAMSDDINAQGHSRKRIFDAINASLTRMKMDYIDIYMLHFFDVDTPVEETMGALNDIVQAGKARYIGVSTMTTGQLAKILMVCDKNGWPRPINMQLQLNCAYREEEREMIPFCMDQGIGVSVFSPLARGLLTNDLQSARSKTDFFTAEMYNDQVSKDIALSVAKVANARDVCPAQIAQAWVLSKPEISSMLVGADTKEQFNSAIAAMETTLSDDEIYELERNYTPCDVISDYTAGKRLPRIARPAKGAFA
ncbi:MAG: aldo/keto reductase [Alphaproteobacteria bacterium]|nr:aldo/keto reductase [Alphaproteobacteria bacterium]